MQLSTSEVIAGGIVAIEGVLSFLSGVLPKASEEETFVNNVLNLIHGAGFNSDKVVLPKNKQSKADIENLISGIVSSNLLSDTINEVIPIVDKIMENNKPLTKTAELNTITPVVPPSASINPAPPPVPNTTLAPGQHP